MSGDLWSCNLCKDTDEKFIVPADEIGVELMKAHLLDKHGITIPHVTPTRRGQFP